MLETVISKNILGHRPDLLQVEIGSRVEVFWPQDTLYHEATVAKVRDKTRLWHFLEYDDGESEWTDLDRCKFRVLPGGIRRRSDDGAEIQDDDSVLSASKNDSFELESHAPADEYQNENHGRKEGKPHSDGIETSSFRRVLQGNDKRHRFQGKENVPSNTTNPETSPSKSAAGTHHHHHQDKEARKDKTAITTDFVLPRPSLFSTPSAELTQVAAFVERFVGQAIQSSSGTNFNSSIEKATKERSGKRRDSSTAKVTSETATGKKRKYSTKKATKETPVKRKRSSSIEKAIVGKKRKNSYERAPKETLGKKRMRPIEKTAKEAGGKTLRATRETPRKKHMHSIGAKVRKFFEGFGWFDGKVTSCDGKYYDITYEDGDSEQCSQDELEKIILTPDLANVEVGSRVAVHLPTNGKYHEATVVRERNKQRPLFLEYNDGHREWTDLRQCTFRLLPGGTRRRDDDEIEDDSGSDDDSSVGTAFDSDDDHDETGNGDSDSEFEFD